VVATEVDSNETREEGLKDETAIPLTEHLRELRKRLIRCCWAVGIGFVVAYGFSEDIFRVLTLPLLKVLPEGNTMIFTGLAEGFFTYFKVSFIAGALLATPVIFYQIWSFTSPGLYDNEKRYILPFTLFSVVFFAGGALFGYFFVFPFAFEYFMSFNSEEITALPSIREYLSFSSRLLIAFGAAFELPIFIVFLSRLGIVTVEKLTRARKYVLIVAFIISAILTPPDVVTQIFMAFPLMILYELGIIGARLFGKKK